MAAFEHYLSVGCHTFFKPFEIHFIGSGKNIRYGTYIEIRHLSLDIGRSIRSASKILPPDPDFHITVPYVHLDPSLRLSLRLSEALSPRLQ